ncbi:GNAT family N-acetyltransferase, partial [Vibrio kagoshimensis]|uniref:GNAT family N-acetyltransferase n=1 Tax=Vibrio kagoshimensis TaxID=2910244 RepID=UPI003D1C01BF
INGMLNNSNLIITAWYGPKLVGISRSITDFHYCCYLSDLAVDEAYQRLGIGKQLQVQTQSQIEPTCKLFLIAARRLMTIMDKLATPRVIVVGCWSAVVKLSHNKAIKTDSQRSAFLVCFYLSVYGTMG